MESLVSRSSTGRGALAELRRLQTRTRIRGSATVSGFGRLDTAARTMAALAPRLGGPARSAVADADAAEQALRDLGERCAAVERGLAFAPADAALGASHAQLLGHFNDGVTGYEQLVAAAASCVAEDGRTCLDNSALSRLREATDLLRGLAEGFTDLRPAGNWGTSR